MCEEIKIKEERISSAEYISFISFLKRTDLGSQYPKERDSIAEEENINGFND